MVQTDSRSKSNSVVEIDAEGLLTRDLNIRLREATSKGAHRIELRHVCGQRYIGTDLNKPVEIEIFGTPGNDLGAFMDGPKITVRGNAQDGCGNTMNNGEIIVHGHAGDITGLAARGGKIFIRDGVGYRAGIHMKEYGEKRPALVIGGTAQDFLGEYMAGGIVILLGLHSTEHKMNFVGTGMHGGVIYIQGELQNHQLAEHVAVEELDDYDHQLLDKYIAKYATYFNIPKAQIGGRIFKKLRPVSKRPYSDLYGH